MKEFINDSGTEKWYKMTTQMEGWKNHKEAAQLSMNVSFTAKSKKQTEVFAKTKTKAEVQEFRENAKKQEQFVKEQRDKMQASKDAVRKMTEAMQQVNFAPIPEVPKNVGKSWPLNKNYYEKVK